MNVAREKTLNQLEGTAPAPPGFRSHVTSEVHRLRDVPLSQLSIEDLRLLIGQEIGLDYLVPIAIERVENQPLASGDFYRGDLLVALLRLPAAFWQQRGHWHRRVEQVASAVVQQFSGMAHGKQQKLAATWEPLREAYEVFTGVPRTTA
jgi:hypothetical protein